MADDLGYGDLGSYGQKLIKTPFLDKMASEGMRFTQYYAGSTVCAPSRCSLMTGLHTGHARIRGNSTVPLQPDDITVADKLKEAGYQTGLIGKWGLGEEGSTGVPSQQGFDYFFGYLNQIKAHNHYPEYLWRNDKKVMLPNEVIFAREGYAKGVGTASVRKEAYAHDLFTSESLEFIERNQSKPFFLYLAYTIPHANNEHHLLGEHGMEVPDYGDYEDENWPEPQKGLAAMITRMDRDIGRILDKLKELDLEENTVVFFTSDNGPHREGDNDPDFFDSNGPFRGIKRDLYEGGIRVPYIAWWPETISAGTENHQPAAFWDFLPTACDIAGIPSPDVDGVSLKPYLLQSGTIDHPALYWEFGSYGGNQAVLQHPWKGIKVGLSENPDTLYNLEEDPSESHNVASQYPLQVKTLESVLKQEHTFSPEFALPWEK